MADSLHQDILAVAKARLDAMLAAGDFRKIDLPLEGVTAIEEREVLEVGWATAIAAYPIIVVSGVGIRSDLGDRTCFDKDGYPLLIRLVDRVQVWSVEERNNHLKWIHKILVAFRGKPLTLTFPNAQCTDILLLPAETIEVEPLAFDLVSRPLPFQVNTRLLRA